jgi:hypothetical protein
MPWSRFALHAVGLLALIALLAVVPACSSPGGPHLPWLHPTYPDSTNVVQRPAYGVPGIRPLYVGGYAGSSYGPESRARIFANNPAGEQLPGPPNLSINQGTWEPE